MAILVTLKGPNTGRQFAIEQSASIVGRQTDTAICLESPAVSRHHARLYWENGALFVEDLNSSNGTFVNGKRIPQKTALTEKDKLQIGPYLFGIRHAPVPSPSEGDLVIREQVTAHPSDHSLHGHDPAHKLQVVLEISQHLARTLDVETLLSKLLDQLLRLFPQADRGMVLLREGDRLVVRAQLCRRAEDPTTYPYSRTIVKRVLEEGVGVLSEDVHSDQRFQASSTLFALDLRTLLCVPLICQDGKRLGVLQLDGYRSGKTFRVEDLQLLTVLGLQTAVVLENAALHAEVLREEGLRQELALAREIQQGFLPTEFPKPQEVGYELFARVNSAREVSGDLYDFFTLKDGRLAFFLGDVSGKGMPAALFMIAVRTLSRHLAAGGESPSETLKKLNTTLAADNPSGMFVTLVHGFYRPADGELILASGGHPPPLLRQANGAVEVVKMQTGRLLGYEGGNLALRDFQFRLAPEETMILYTDGFTEAQTVEGKRMFGVEGLQEVLGGGSKTKLSLEACADQAKAAVEKFIGGPDLQDDLTLLLLRRGQGQ